MIRLCTSEDIDWMMAIAEESYPFKINVDGLRKWFIPRLGNPNMIVARGEHSAAMAYIHIPPWRFDESDCELEYLCSRKSRFGAIELLKTLRFINSLRKERGCARFYINSRLADLEPIARRLGGRLAGKGYVIE